MPFLSICLSSGKKTRYFVYCMHNYQGIVKGLLYWIGDTIEAVGAINKGAHLVIW